MLNNAVGFSVYIGLFLIFYVVYEYNYKCSGISILHMNFCWLTTWQSPVIGFYQC